MTPEYAQLNRRSLSRSLFPERWGAPPYEERVREQWILRHCQLEADRSAETDAALAGLKARYRVLSLLARRWGPQ